MERLEIWFPKFTNAEMTFPFDSRKSGTWNNQPTMGSNESESDYYAFMNIRKNATPEEIGQAFRRLSLIYHPDRHTDPVLRARSQELFDKVRKMYEVLIDPQRREIYDAVGEKGLELSGWEVVERKRSREEVIAEYIRLQKLYELDMMQESTNPKGCFILYLTMGQLFNDDLRRIFRRLIFLNGMTLVQTVQLPVTSKHRFTLGGKLETFNGVGEGILTLKLHSKLGKRTHGDLILEYDGEAKCGVKISHLFFNLFFVTASCGTPTSFFDPRYGFSIDFSRPLSPKCIGVLTVNFGRHSSVTTTLNFSTSGKNNLTVGCVVGLPSSMLTAAYAHHFGCSGSNLQTSLKVGTMGVIADYIYQGQITQFTSVHYMFQFYYPLGVFVTLKLKRGRQVYETSISLAERDFPAKAILTGMLVSFVCRGVFAYLLKPLFHKIKDKLSNEAENPESPYNKRKREFELSVALMSKEAKRMQTMEAQRQGLVITSAWYGSFHSNSTPDRVIDVTYPVQLLVRDSKLIVFGTQSKSIMNGFFDPCPGREKKLKINYTFRGVTHEYTFDDYEPVVLPKRGASMAPRSNVGMTCYYDYFYQLLQFIHIFCTTNWLMYYVPGVVIPSLFRLRKSPSRSRKTSHRASSLVNAFQQLNFLDWGRRRIEDC